MDGLVQQVITDRNGHTKTVWVSQDKSSPTLASTRSRLPVSPPPTSSRTAAKITSSDVENWIDRNNLPLANDEDFVDIVNAAIVSSGSYTDSSFKAAYDQVFYANFGGYTVDTLRAALGTAEVRQAEPIGVLIVSSNDPRVRSGEVFDQVEHDGVIYSRSRDGVYPADVYSMRFQFNRELTSDEARHARDLIAYAWTSRIRGQAMGDEEADTPFSIVVGGDSTKSRSGDTGYALSEWEDMVRDYLALGTHQKTAELRLPPVDPNLTVEIYYDNVYRAS